MSGRESLREARCEHCSVPQGEARTEAVEGRGPGWKCVCGWWNWINAVGESASACEVARTSAPQQPPSLIADGDYDHRNDSKFSLAECEAAVGQEATLTLTGSIVSADVGCGGAYVKFKPDERFGFGDFKVGIDLDALTVSEGAPDA